jgi:hypothetical protein
LVEVERQVQVRVGDLAGFEAMDLASVGVAIG